ncbi:MAG TPA: hypothetical protein PKH07_04660 [bacterium]|nr:hypothetical protein [bacterium]
MSIADLFRKKTEEEGDPVAREVKRHLEAMHKYFQLSPHYAATAPHWRRLEKPEVIEWLGKNLREAMDQRGPVTQTLHLPDVLLIVTVIQAVQPQAIRAAFAPSGYLTYVEKLGFFEAPRNRRAAAAFVLGHEHTALRVDLTWVPPLDNRPYQVIFAQDILTPQERQEIGI